MAKRQMDSPHPIEQLIVESEGMGKDCLAEKLLEEGFKRIGFIDLDQENTPKSFTKGLLGLLIKLQDIEFNQIRIIPSYMSRLSRYSVHDSNPSKPKMPLTHSNCSNLHVVYIK